MGAGKHSRRRLCGSHLGPLPVSTSAAVRRRVLSGKCCFINFVRVLGMLGEYRSRLQNGGLFQTLSVGTHVLGPVRLRWSYSAAHRTEFWWLATRRNHEHLPAYFTLGERKGVLGDEAARASAEPGWAYRLVAPPLGVQPAVAGSSRRVRSGPSHPPASAQGAGPRRTTPPRRKRSSTASTRFSSVVHPHASALCPFDVKDRPTGSRRFAVR